MNNNELLNLNTIPNLEAGSSVSGTTFITELVAVIPNAVAAPFQRHHEVEVKKQLMESAMDHQTSERTTICETIVELAKLKELDSERFQMLMVAYGMKHF